MCWFWFLVVVDDEEEVCAVKQTIDSTKSHLTNLCTTGHCAAIMASAASLETGHDGGGVVLGCGEAIGPVHV